MKSPLILIIIPLFWIKGMSSYSFLLQHCKFDLFNWYINEWIIFCFFSSTGVSSNQNKNVHQTPTDLLREINDTVNLTCKHYIKDYDTILWYHQSQGNTSLNLVGFTSYAKIQTVEKTYQDWFNVSGDGEKEAFLHILKLRHPEDSGLYFCAARMTQ